MQRGGGGACGVTGGGTIVSKPGSSPLRIIYSEDVKPAANYSGITKPTANYSGLRKPAANYNHANDTGRVAV